MAVFLVVITLIGYVIAIPFFGWDVVFTLEQTYDYSDGKTVAYLKYIQFISQVGLFVLPAFIYAYLKNRKPLQSLALKTRPGLVPVFLSIVLIFVSIPFINSLVRWNEQMAFPQFLKIIEDWMRDMEDQTALLTDALLHVNSVWGLVVNLFIIALMAAIGEELLFRGVILTIFKDTFKNIHLAVLFSALIFSAFHMQFYGFVPRAVLGILFGYIFVWTGSLWIPIILHFVFNSISVIVSYLYQIGKISTNYEDFGEAPSLLLVFSSLAGTFVIMYLIQKRSQQFKYEQ